MGDQGITPGYKSTEFWIALGVSILGGLLTAGVIAPDTTAGKIIGAILVVASTLGYTASRTVLKK